MNSKTEDYIELVFAGNACPGDLQVIAEATSDQPGRMRLGLARIEPANGHGSRVYSLNGGALIGVIQTGAPDPPYNFTYMLANEVAHRGQGGLP